MGRSLATATVFALLAGVGCGGPSNHGDGPGVDAGPRDAALDAGVDAGPPWAGPVAPEPPRLVCPAGWRPLPGTDGTAQGCDPWAPSGPVPCGEAEVQHLGTSACARVGTACPAGDYADGLPTGAVVLYVMPGAIAGDGTRAAPYGSIADAVAAAPDGAILALAKGTHQGGFTLTRPVTLWGACAAETILTRIAGRGFAVINRAADATLRDLQLVAGSGITSYGDRLELRGVVLRQQAALAIAVLSGSMTLDDVSFHDIPENALEIANANVVLRRVVFANVGRGAVVQRAGTLVGEDLSLQNVGAIADQVISVAEGGRVTLSRVAMIGAGGVLVSSGAELDLTDGFFRFTATGVRDSDAVIAIDDGRAHLSRVRMEQPLSLALFAAAGGELLLEDAVVLSPVSVAPTGGRALDVERGGQATLRRVQIEQATQLAVLATDETAVVSLEDVTIRDTRSDPDGQWGRAIQAQLGARVTGTRLLLDGNREASELAASAGTSVTLTDLDVHATLERPCVTTTCVGNGGGIGIGSYGAAVTLENVRVRQCALSALQLARDGVMDVHVGEVSDNAVGANVQVDMFDVTRLADRVAYLRNGTNLDTSSLPVPDATVPAL